MKRVIISNKSPKVVGPYSHAILTSSKYRMELAGQIGIDPEKGALVEGIEAQTEQVFKNIGVLLEEVGWNYENITKCRVFLAEMSDYVKINEVYSKYFKSDFPARMALSVKGLPLGALVEIECCAEGEEIVQN